MKTAYFDCFCGAGGDMIVAAMIDAGLDEQLLKQQLSSLGIKDLEIKISHTTRCGIKAVRFEPTAPPQHYHRHLGDIVKVIKDSGVSETVKSKSIEIFKKLAEAEALVHRTETSSVHFHEVGAVDSIVDIVAACIGMEALKIDKVCCSTLAVGGGTVKTEHGILPVPAPATAELIRNAPTIGGPEQIELLTPTGAAVLTSFATEFGAMPQMKIEAIGHGAGMRELKSLPNIVRLVIGNSEAAVKTESDYVILLEANCDDITGELAGHFIEELMANGALDAFSMPVYMKHNRPAIILSVLCGTDESEKFENYLFEQGVTLGIRKQVIQRSKLKRDYLEVETEFGKIRIKRGFLGEKIVFAKPEFSDCEKAAAEHKISLKTVMETAVSAYKQKR